MALISTAQLKSYLRIQHTADDTLLADLLTQAKALVESHIGRPIAAREATWTDRAETLRAYGVVTTLMIPESPVAAEGVTITDADGATVDADDYTVETRTGMVRAARGVVFSNGPYTITATTGLSAHPDYATRLEPLVNGALRDTVADAYLRRSPAAASEGAGGGVQATYATVTELPPRVVAALRPITFVGPA